MFRLSLIRKPWTICSLRQYTRTARMSLKVTLISRVYSTQQANSTGNLVQRCRITGQGPHGGWRLVAGSANGASGIVSVASWYVLVFAVCTGTVLIDGGTVYRVHPLSAGKNILVICGPGNNGKQKSLWVYT